jgi:hypothetical protein
MNGTAVKVDAGSAVVVAAGGVVGVAGGKTCTLTSNVPQPDRNRQRTATARMSFFMGLLSGTILLIRPGSMGSILPGGADVPVFFYMLSILNPE